MDIRRKLLRGFWEFVGNTRRQLRRLVISPSLVVDYARFRRAIGRRDWLGVRAMLRTLAEPALKAKDFRILLELGSAALRLDEPQLSVDLTCAGRLYKRLAQPTDWQGENISDATLVVRLMERRERTIATAMPLAGHILAASKRAVRTIVVADPRIVPLFQRTLPEITLCAVDADLKSYVEGRVVTAGLNDLQRVLGYDNATIARLHVPLTPDADEVNRMRARYRNGRELPLIGICWESPQFGKDSPPLAPWARLVRSVQAQFVSLQRGHATDQAAVLSAGDLSRIIIDPTVDQMVDVDRFASQLAALDLIVTMSNTGAHLAGALGKRMLLVRDDLFRVAWPYLSDVVPWYPATTVIGKNGRSWERMFDEVIETARAAMAKALACDGKTQND
jgi:hypothetical protein